MSGFVRITSGELRGRRVHTPPGTGTRPLLTRVRKSLADVLRPRLTGARLLDLFAGSGAIAFELLSNGGESAVLCELDAGTATLVRNNAAELGLEARVRVLTGDARQLVPRLAEEGETFDAIVVAPPYGLGLQAKILAALETCPILAPRGVVVVQRDAREEGGGEVVGLERVSVRTYGRTVFEFYEGPR